MHTGDYRLTVEDLKDMTFLYQDETKSVLKSFDQLYIDTTFCNTSASQFPCRKMVFQQAVDKMRNWLHLSCDHAIFISFAGLYLTH